MTEQEFITQYVAENSKMIENGIEQGLSRLSMVQGLKAKAKETWEMLQSDEAEGAADSEEADEKGLSLQDLKPGNIYTAYLHDYYSSDDQDEARKIIFSPRCVTESFGEAIYALFVLYQARSGSFVLDVWDDNAAHHCSRTSDICVCRRHNCVGIKVEQLQDYVIRVAGKEEVERVFEILESAYYCFEYDPATLSAKCIDIASCKVISSSVPRLSPNPSEV